MMNQEKSRLMLFATIAAIVAVAGNFISASVLLQTESNSWLVFSAIAVGSSLLAAYVTLVASQKQSLEARKTKTRVFLSYAREDEEQVDKLYKKLQSEGFEPWMDVKNLTPGENWVRSTEQAIEDSNFLLAVISRNSIDKRGFVQTEIKFALDLASEESGQNARIIPVRLDNSSIPEPLSKFYAVNLFDANGFDKLVRAFQTI